MRPTVRLRYTGARPCLANGRHLAPGDVVDVPEHVAKYFLARAEGEIVAAEPESPADAGEPAVTHRDPKVKKR